MTGRWLLLAAGAAGAAVGGIWFAPRSGPPVGPLARFPAAVDLGERQPGEIAAAELPITNAGDQPLVVSDIRTSCSCAGMETEQDGRRVRVTDVTIPPGVTAPLSFRVSVVAEPGRPQAVRIGFRTNDPAVPGADVAATIPRVVGVPFARPSIVSLGAVRVGRPRGEVFDLYPNGLTGVRVVSVTSSRPELVTAALEPPAGGDPTEPGGAVVAQVRVTPVADRPADVDAVVTVTTTGDGLPSQDTAVRVTGRVRHPVECLPTTAMFTGNINTCTLYLIGTDAARFSAALTGRPDWLTAEVAPEPELGGRPQARLILTRAATKPAADGSVRVAVTADDEPPFELEVPVLCPTP